MDGNFLGGNSEVLAKGRRADIWGGVPYLWPADRFNLWLNNWKEQQKAGIFNFGNNQDLALKNLELEYNKRLARYKAMQADRGKYV